MKCGNGFTKGTIRSFNGIPGSNLVQVSIRDCRVKIAGIAVWGGWQGIISAAIK